MTVRSARADRGHLAVLCSCPSRHLSRHQTAIRQWLRAGPPVGDPRGKFRRASLAHVLLCGGSILLFGPGERSVSRASGPGRSRWADDQRRHPRRSPLREGSAGSGPAGPPALAQGGTRAAGRPPPRLPVAAATDRFTPATTRARASIRSLALVGAARLPAREESADAPQLDCFELGEGWMSEGIHHMETVSHSKRTAVPPERATAGRGRRPLDRRQDSPAGRHPIWVLVHTELREGLSHESCLA